jgi:hypothetical protein
MEKKSGEGEDIVATIVCMNCENALREKKPNRYSI